MKTNDTTAENWKENTELNISRTKVVVKKRPLLKVAVYVLFHPAPFEPGKLFLLQWVREKPLGPAYSKGEYY
jgi:hypothetical protein